MSRTHEALLRAEAKHESRHLKRYEPPNVEQKLLQLNLSKKQLANQNLSELIQSLHSINACIREPEVALDSYFDEAFFGRKDIITLLLKRKWLVLELIDSAVTNRNMKKIRSILQHVQNRKVRDNIEKSLLFLNRKNEILRNEYRSIAVLRADIQRTNKENPKALNGPPPLNAPNFDKKKSSQKDSKPLFGKESLPLIMTGGLIAIWGIGIALTHFLKIPVPVINEYAFLIILGFLLGMLSRLSPKRPTQKKENN
jgi:hypothetical protein